MKIEIRDGLTGEIAHTNTVEGRILKNAVLKLIESGANNELLVSEIAKMIPTGSFVICRWNECSDGTDAMLTRVEAELIIHMTELT